MDIRSSHACLRLQSDLALFHRYQTGMSPNTAPATRDEHAQALAQHKTTQPATTNPTQFRLSGVSAAAANLCLSASHLPLYGLDSWLAALDGSLQPGPCRRPLPSADTCHECSQATCQRIPAFQAEWTGKIEKRDQKTSCGRNEIGTYVECGITSPSVLASLAV